MWSNRERKLCKFYIQWGCLTSFSSTNTAHAKCFRRKSYYEKLKKKQSEN